MLMLSYLEVQTSEWLNMKDLSRACAVFKVGVILFWKTQSVRKEARTKYTALVEES